ncbi:hypothetical protein M2163_006921 [Streptomyces sp. SAI-135]|nr:hypothetical protein [Streptomyces sp. SAI-135]MDH6619813.1 hypothetical protein [Streptomyces sp. SAI-135]
MVSIPYLDKADLAPLADAAASWKALPAKYEALQREFEQRVVNHLKGHWEGDAAEAAFTTMGKARTEYENAATEAERIAKLLLDAHGEFAASQRQLHALLDEARNDHYKVYDDGRVEDVDPRWDSPTASASPGLAKERKTKLDSLVSRLTRVLEAATAADEAASSALERDANGDGQGFNTSVYTTLDAVEADQAAALMNKKGRLSDAEITKLNLLLSANKNNPEFSREFAVKTGGENMLGKYNELMSPPAGTTLSKAQLAQLKELKSNLGTTIGTATTSDDHRKGGPDPEITKFQNDLLKAGQRDFNANPTESPYGLSGYQLTSSLMSEGKWDKDFLQDYGDALITAEKNGANAGQNPDAYWGVPADTGLDEHRGARPHDRVHGRPGAQPGGLHRVPHLRGHHRRREGGSPRLPAEGPALAGGGRLHGRLREPQRLQQPGPRDGIRHLGSPLRQRRSPGEAHRRARGADERTRQHHRRRP